MSRTVALFFRYIPSSSADESKTSTGAPLAAKPRFGGAFGISLLIHTLPVLLLAFAPHLLEEKTTEKPVILYSVQLEKKRAVVTPNATVRKDATRSNAKRSGSADLDLTGQQRAQKASYEMQLASRIERQRYYPQRARQMRQEGQPIVRIVLDTAGNLTQVAIESSSGITLLDETALDIVRRAIPFPAPPAEYAEVVRQRGDNRMVFRAPISFGMAKASP